MVKLPKTEALFGNIAKTLLFLLESMSFKENRPTKTNSNNYLLSDEKRFIRSKSWLLMVK